MQTTNSSDQRLWKRCVQDALFELDPRPFWGNWKPQIRLLRCGVVNLNPTPILIHLNGRNWRTVYTLSAHSDS
jgi:hypothetical protein